MRRVLEVCVESIAAAAAAAEGGADRVELCADLSVEGLTPEEETMRLARAACPLPIVAMVRPRAGDFHYTPDEVAAMERAIDAARAARMDGVVLGALTPECEIDASTVERLVARAGRLPVTFHRAFDAVPDPIRALDALVELGVARILTSGGAPTALEGAADLARLVEHAARRLTIVVGGGVRAANLRELRRRTRALEFHSSVGGEVTPERVRELAALAHETG